MTDFNIEKTRDKINKILENTNYWFPYFHKKHFSDNIMKIFAAVDMSGKLPLLEAVKIYHDSIRRNYHERRGTKPIEYIYE